MSTKFFTNKDGNTLLKKFEGVLEHNPSLSELDILVGYFRSAGFFHLQPHLEGLDQVRILVGINVDELTYEADQQGKRLQRVDDEKVRGIVSDGFCEEVAESEYDSQTEEAIDRFIENIKAGKIELRAHPSKQLHAKFYIFRPENFNEHNGGEVITGSSNLSERGLGVKAGSKGYEFNVALRDFNDISFATDEFNHLWEEATEISADVIDKARQRTHLVDDITSKDLYYKLLIEYFGEEIEYDPSVLADLPEGIMRLEYQAHAVQQGYRILKRHNGLFLADVVGLGKTYVATMIARKFFYSSETQVSPWTLIVHPPALESLWKDTVRTFKLDRIDFISSGSLHKVEEVEKYSLIIVDEAHKFRHDTSDAYSQLQAICKAPAPDGNQRKVILVSATPLNNKPDDIKNQLLLFQDERNSTLEISIGDFFRKTKKKYDASIKLMKKGHEVPEVDKIYEEIREEIFQHVLVRRTRADLEEFFADDLKKQKITFPHVNLPTPLLYELDDELDHLYERTVDLISSRDGCLGMTYTRYKLFDNLLPEFQQMHGQAKQVGQNLAELMTTLLLKRLDSSFFAFHESLKRFVRQAKLMDKMAANDAIYVDPTPKLLELIENDDMDGVEEYLNSREDKICHKRNHFDADFFNKLKHDQEILVGLESEWHKIIKKKEDPKLEKFIEQLPKMLRPKLNPGEKVVIFSESKDTTNYLFKELMKLEYDDVLCITSENRDRMSDIIRNNFDASIGENKRSHDYNILVTTEVLAEGVNLNRSNSIVNYDTPWNSTKLMQRVGRVNRLYGSAEQIYIYNFYPAPQIDDDIVLKERAALKLKAFHLALGSDSQIYTDDEKTGSFGLFEKDIFIDDEFDERLRYLTEVRELRDNNFEVFTRIKDLPFRIRNAVQDTDLSVSTICFLRNSREDTFRKFFRVADDDFDELNFLQCAEIMEKHADSLPQKLPAEHYHHVVEAREYYISELRKKFLLDHSAGNLTTQEKSAVNLLKMLSNGMFLDAIQRKKIETALVWLNYGKSQNLRRDLTQISAQNKDVTADIGALLNQAIATIDKHIIGVNWAMQEKVSESLAKENNTIPEIIISQTYSEG